MVFYSAAFDWRKVAEARGLGAKAWLVKGVNRLSDVVDQVAQCLPHPPADGGPHDHGQQPTAHN